MKIVNMLLKVNSQQRQTHHSTKMKYQRHKALRTTTKKKFPNLPTVRHQSEGPLVFN